MLGSSWGHVALPLNRLMVAKPAYPKVLLLGTFCSSIPRPLQQSEANLAWHARQHYGVPFPGKWHLDRCILSPLSGENPIFIRLEVGSKLGVLFAHGMRYATVCARPMYITLSRGTSIKTQVFVLCRPIVWLVYVRALIPSCDDRSSGGRWSRDSKVSGR